MFEFYNSIHGSLGFSGRRLAGRIAARILALILVFAMLLTSPGFAVQVGPADDNGNYPDLTGIKYALVHDVFNLRGGYLELSGSNLEGITVLLNISGRGLQQIGEREIDASGFIKINLTAEEAQDFTGMILVGNKSFNLNTSSFPNLQGSDKATITSGQGESITFTGNNLTGLNSGSTSSPMYVSGQFGTGLNFTTLGTTANAGSITLVNPSAPGRLGTQDIVFKRSSPGSAANPKIEVEFSYISAFRIIEPLKAGEINMFPNTGSKGDTITLRSKSFTDTRKYQVYFLTAIDGTDAPSEKNRAKFVSLATDVDGTDDDILTVQVPVHKDFELRSYYVLVADVLNNQVVAEQYVRVPGTDDLDEFVVIRADFKPSIISLYPDKGPDTGSKVEIKANHVLSLNIPDLATTGDFKSSPTLTSADRQLNINYTDGKYKDRDVTIKREITMQLGKQIKFSKNALGNLDLEKGSPDRIMVETEPITDAHTDPKKDLVIEIRTVLTEKGTGRTYVFNQIVTKKDAYEFIPSTYTPVIDEVTPNIIHVNDSSNNFVKMNNEVLLSIKGGQFLVDRVVLPNGTVVVRKPMIQIKMDDASTSTSSYQLAFYPNYVTVAGQKHTGVILYKDQESDPVPLILKDQNGQPIKAQIIVLNNKNEEVTGTSGNQIGTKILVMIPKEAKIKRTGIKHIQVTNPTRGSAREGYSALKKDVLELVKTTDVPVIESVKPNIVTVQGGDDIIITGANIAAGAKLFLDGDEIKSFSRELDPAGNKIYIKFKAPAGREGVTQILLQNPSGGMAISDFTYVNSFDKDPVFKDFAPDCGTYGTIVVANGDNFLKPDPTAVTERGVDAFRLIGSRITIDGRDVNDYKKDSAGRIVFSDYTAPNAATVITKDAGKAAFTTLYENTFVQLETGGRTKKAWLEPDYQGNPAIKTDEEEFGLKTDPKNNAAGHFLVINKQGQTVGTAAVSHSPSGTKGLTTVTITEGAKTHTAKIYQNNQLFRKGLSPEDEEVVVLANYADSVTMKSAAGERYTLFYNFKSEPILTNGKERTYILKPKGNEFVAVDRLQNEIPVTPTDTGVNLDGLDLKMITPYTVDAASGVINGNRSKVLSKSQILFEVPPLDSGRGYKDLEIINPDTKRASKTGKQGFYYISQSSSKPVISDISPNKGSVDGGYYVTITGSQFEDDCRIFVDSVEVPKSDMYIAINGRRAVIKMPATKKKLNDEYGTDHLAVPVVVLNPDGGTTGRKRGFTYIIPMSSPQITKILPSEGSSNGGDIVEITGYEFRYYEPYQNLVGDQDYQVGDRFQDLYRNGKWDDLLGVHDPNSITKKPLTGNPFYDHYYESPILPKVYFGENEAKIVEFTRGYIKVLTPRHAAGVTEVYVINNDSGVSNKLRYSYSSVAPKIDSLMPDFGRRGGQEPKEIFGSSIFSSVIEGYINDDDTAAAVIPHVRAIVRFGKIDNTKVPRIQENSGLINNQRATISLDGSLTLQYYGDKNQVKMTIQQDNQTYTREFTYQNGEVYIPVGMLKDKAGKYFVPSGMAGVDSEGAGASPGSGTDIVTPPTDNYVGPYEYVKVYIKDRRVMVERGYAPKVVYDSENHITVYTPSYHTIGRVEMNLINPDGGSANRPFTYTNPASDPKILRIEPQALSYDKQRWQVESSVEGGIDIEIIGLDLREGIEVTMGGKKAAVKEITTKKIGDKTYDLVVATVPKAGAKEIDLFYPIILKNKDDGLATSNNIEDLIGPNHGSETLPFYLVYKKPLSFPKVDSVTPGKTSVAGGNKIVIRGSDFRKGAYVIIGTRAGIPIYDGVIEELGKKFTITTPDNMTLGVKDVQVLNNDYGTGLLKNGITVVSAPTIDGEITFEDGKSLNRIHVTGSQKIRIKGTGFQKGATVYFGGQYLPADDKTPQGEQGIYRDDKIYYVKDGAKAKSVKFVSENELIVETPEVDREGAFKIVVLNKDGGITSDKTTITYRVPVPSDPANLKATTVDDRYIKLYDYVSENQKYFEIYVYIGSKPGSTLVSEGFKDFQYLGVTEIEPYKIIELPGYNKMSPADKVHFVVKAVNKFGQSGWSNIATIDYHKMMKVKELGPPDLDGPIGVPKDQDFAVNASPGLVHVTFGAKPKTHSVNVPLARHIDRYTGEIRLSVPSDLIKNAHSRPASLMVDTGETSIYITPTALNTPNLRQLTNYTKGYANLTEKRKMQSPSFRVRGHRQISQVFQIGFGAASGPNTKPFHRLTTPLHYSIKVPAGIKDPQNAKIYGYDPSQNRYVPLPSQYRDGRVSAKILYSGYYVLVD